jgi:3'(2'), 5'-bisphosphate nucleotidase
VNNEQLINEMKPIVERAGAEILKIYESDFDVQTKADQSPLTQADLNAHEVIVGELAALTPEIPIISEESEPPSFEVRSTWSRYWLVDPLDGTKEFINRNGEFTVNIALIENHAPVLGVVGVPALGDLYTGNVADGEAFKFSGSEVTRLAVRPMNGDHPLTVVASRSHGGERLEQYLEALKLEFGEVARTPVGSSLKLCILAEGAADLYPRLGPTSEWDIGAAQAVLIAAGGAVWTFAEAPLGYNQKDSLLNPEFLAVGDATFPWFERLPVL